MTIKIAVAVLAGIGIGATIFPEILSQHMGILIDFGLCLLLFFVGIDIGKQRNVFNQLKQMGYKILVVPLMVAIGSILGAILGGLLLHIPYYEAGAVGAGFGWYSLSAIELSRHSAQLGTLAFLTNVIREITALLIIPLVAKYVGFLEAIAPAGATAMDTTLPVISNSTNASTVVISFFTGVILSSLVPILVPLMMTLGRI